MTQKWWTLAAVCGRRLHAPARHHDRERRAARHPARRSTPRCRTCSGSSTPTRSRWPRCCSPPARWPTSSAGAALRVGIAVFTAGSLLCGLAAEPAVPRPGARLPGHRRRDHVRHLAGAARPAPSTARSAASRSASSARSPASPSPSARCSAACSPAACRGAGSSSSTSRSASPRSSSRCCEVEESRDPRARRPDWVGFVTFSVGARRARLRADPRATRDGWGSTTGRRLARRRRRAARRVRRRRAARSASRCSTSRCCASRPSSAAWSPRSAISASLFSLLPYLVLYLQNVLGYSAVETGVRLLRADRRDLRHRRRSPGG